MHNCIKKYNKKKDLPLELRFIFVTHTDDLGWYITSNHLFKKDVRSKPQPDCQKAKCYAKAVPVLHHRQYSNSVDVSGKLSCSYTSMEQPEPSK